MVYVGATYHQHYLGFAYIEVIRLSPLIKETPH